MKQAELVLYEPHSVQLKFHQSPSRFRVAALGRQAGKSTMAMNELLMKAWTTPHTGYWFISPVFAQAKDQYRKLKNFLPPECITRSSDTELRIDLISSSWIEYKSGEVLDRLRGTTLHGVIIDEVRDQHRELWPMVIRPMLTTTKGWAAFISTPNGYDDFYDLHEMHRINPDWSAFQAPSVCNPLFTPEEFESARQIMSEQEFQQEILAEFVEVGRGKAYLNHGPHNQAEQNPFAVTGEKWSPYLPIVVGLDFNVGLMMWVLMQVKGQDFYIGDEISLSNTHTQECVKVLIERVKGHTPGVVLVGDASGKSQKTSAAGSTDYSIIMEALRTAQVPFRNLTPESNPPVKDRINKVNSRLKAADGSVHLWYHPKRCMNVKRDFERVTIKQGSDGFFLDKKDPLLTHASDSLGYPICHYSKEWVTRPGTLSMVMR